ncbi:MAG: hypothetical protein K0R38_782 [Polyangiaceae bacterium]|nr:hypothetical protein [Polyangiaceae bacterium]
MKAAAVTLKSGPSGIELYASLKNGGESPACGTAFSVELFDDAEQSVAAGSGGLLVKRFFRLADGSGTAACLAPGDVSMIALRNLSLDLPPEQVRRVEYWCNYWALDVVPLGELKLSEVTRVLHADGTSFTGVLENGLDAPLPSAAVAVFPLDDAGRPLDVALAEGMTEVPAGGSWSFETSAVADPGIARASFPTRGP